MKEPAKILIIGNGFGGVYALKSLHKILGKSGAELSLIGEKNYFLFTPLLHEVATGGINPENIIQPIRKVLGKCFKNFYLGKAEYINLAERTVKVGDIILSYDYLVLAPGAETNYYGIPGAEENCFPLKSIEDAIKIKNHCIMQMEKAAHIKDEKERKKILKFAIVGGGPTGVELAAELHELIKENFSRYYSKELIRDTSVALIQMGSELVPQFGQKVRKKSLQVLNKKGIDVLLDTKVKEVSSEGALFESGSRIETETMIWVAGIKPAELKFDQEVEKAKDGKIIVNEFLQMKNFKEVFAIGDLAAFTPAGAKNPLPALAQVAEKEAKAVAKNIKLIRDGKNPEAFVYHHMGDMISLGRWMAIGEMFDLTFSGGLTWWFWRTVYLSKLISFRKKVEVAIDWTIDIFSSRDISQI